MIRQAFTPGPWKYDELTAKVWDAEDMPVCIPTLNNGTEGREANARLIAQAPAMAEFLERCAMMICDHGPQEFCPRLEAKRILFAIQGGQQ